MGTNRRDSPVEGRSPTHTPLGSRQRLNSPMTGANNNNISRSPDNSDMTTQLEQISSSPESPTSTTSPLRFLNRENTGPGRVALTREPSANAKSSSNIDCKPTATNARYILSFFYATLSCLPYLIVFIHEWRLICNLKLSMAIEAQSD